MGQELIVVYRSDGLGRDGFDVVNGAGDNFGGRGSETANSCGGEGDAGRLCGAQSFKGDDFGARGGGFCLSIGIDNRAAVNVGGLQVGGLNHLQTGSRGQDLSKSVAAILSDGNDSLNGDSVGDGDFRGNTTLGGLQFNVVVFVVNIVVIVVKTATATGGGESARGKSVV